MAIIQCPKCGAMVSDTASFCPKCGAPIAQSAPQQQPEPAQQPYNQQPYNQQPANPYPAVQPTDAPSTGLNILSLLFPIVGWILYFVYRDKEPVKAKSCSKFAWIGFGIGLVLNIITLFAA